jgi:putative SOS response-associated peptidase YedK
MCGRYTNTKPPDAFATLFRAKQDSLSLAPRYNIAPSSDVLACRETPEHGRELVLLHWGLVPSWAKDPKSSYRMINARAETVAEKPAYRAAFKRRRCLIAADGFYEWKPGTPKKQPFYIRLKGGEPFAFAGLWEHWEQEGKKTESCTIIVTDANKLMAPIHDRMPVILAPQDYDRWLDPALQEPAAILPLLRPYPAGDMEAYPVSTLVNSPKNDRPELIAPE